VRLVLGDLVSGELNEVGVAQQRDQRPASLGREVLSFKIEADHPRCGLHRVDLKAGLKILAHNLAQRGVEGLDAARGEQVRLGQFAQLTEGAFVGGDDDRRRHGPAAPFR